MFQKFRRIKALRKQGRQAGTVSQKHKQEAKSIVIFSTLLNSMGQSFEQTCREACSGESEHSEPWKWQVASVLNTCGLED